MVVRESDSKLRKRAFIKFDLDLGSKAKLREIIESSGAEISVEGRSTFTLRNAGIPNLLKTLEGYKGVTAVYEEGERIPGSTYRSYRDLDARDAAKMWNQSVNGFSQEPTEETGDLSYLND